MKLCNNLTCCDCTHTLCISLLQDVMVLNKANKVSSLPDEKGKPLYRFVVKCGLKGKVFVMSAADQRSKSEWLCAVKEVNM